MKKIRNIIIVLILLVFTNYGTFKLASSGYFYNLTKDEEKMHLQKMKFLEKKVEDDFLYKVDKEKLRQGELKGMVASLGDPYSEYLTLEDFDALAEQTNGKFFGIGVSVSSNEEGQILVIAPIKDTPAEKVGIKTGDLILKVNGEPVSGNDLQAAVAKIKGDKGTSVKITIYRPSTKETKDIDVKRDEIKLETVISNTIKDLGYIGITQFNDNTYDEFTKALNNLKEKNVKGLIIDLRGNPGGTVDSVEKIANELLPEGTIVSAKNRDGQVVFDYKSDKEYVNLPMAVLINGGSASASEILAGAIRDFKMGTLIGEKSFGKGIVQSVFPFPDGSGLKITTSEYFTPSGENIHKKGIKPDIEVKLPENVKGIGIEHLDTDNQLKKAIEVLEK
ncbi:carboxyl-terminal processing protease [Peptoniphilus koenoeneniae]|uniref:Carboxyl-terminal processing protease n=3 Tax=Peptoniphilus TaxID=162289 RepID=A0ABU0AVI0_9FIRM|nr:S41 family peptidase [Peptoniphilus koenoeneniae]MDQ0274822.1 carboxyl-terminal processing protease [Peptoniphilus koenoeneniae]